MDLSIFKNARYYNKPEGEDYTGKMIATNGLMLMGAIPLATGDMLMFTKPKGYLGTIGVYAKWMGPAIGMASFFTTTVYAANHIRGKDDV
jgi:NADH dehydrogenase (ubiquinone) 1 alpha subcomplex subunit 11